MDARGAKTTKLLGVPDLKFVNRHIPFTDVANELDLRVVANLTTAPRIARLPTRSSRRPTRRPSSAVSLGQRGGHKSAERELDRVKKIVQCGGRKGGSKLTNDSVTSQE
jgi:hypothetical protein